MHPMNQWLYKTCHKLPGFKQWGQGYGYCLKQLTPLSLRQRQDQVGNVYRQIILAGLVFLMGLVYLSPGLLYLVLFIVFYLTSIDLILDYKMTKMNNQLLREQIQFNDLLRQYYYDYKTVDDGLYEACLHMPEESQFMMKQGELMTEILGSSQVKEKVTAYNEKAPNKYLQILLNLCYLTQEYGDSLKEGQSSFMASLTSLTNELRVEQQKREALNRGLKSLNIIVIIPVLAVLPIESWASYHFEPLAQFYSSPWGVLMEVVFFLTVVGSFYLLRKIQNNQWKTKKVQAIQRADEVAGCQSIVLMLVHHDRLGIYDVVEWLSLFTTYYKEAFDRCLMDSTLGSDQAFCHLEAIDDPPFKAFINKLKAAATNITLAQAFDDLRHEKLYYLERRKKINDTMVENYVSLGRSIGFIPVYGVILCYLIIPMIVASIQSLNQFYDAVM